MRLPWVCALCSSFVLSLAAGCDSERLEVAASGGATGGGGEWGGAGTVKPFPDAVGCDHSRFAVNADVVRSCVLKVSCTPFDPLDVISVCVTLDTQTTFKTSACRDAKSCADVTRCTGESWLTSPCDASDGTWKCDGSRAVNCEDGYAVDCAASGGSCVMYDDTSAGPRARCQVLPSCTDATGGFHCASPDLLYECAAGHGFGRDCAAYGGSCVESRSGASCLDPLPTCQGDALHCDGSVASQCIDGSLYQSDCASVGLSCESSSTYCLAPGCTPAHWESCSESCAGSELTFCYGGAPYSIDCKDFGFSTCATFRRADGTPYASCAG